MKNRTMRYWLESGTHVIIEERETFDKYHKGFRRRWHTQRIGMSLDEFTKMAKDIEEQRNENSLRNRDREAGGSRTNPSHD